MIYICGDLHGDVSIHKLNTTAWPIQNELTEDDVLIILGDFGLIWQPYPTKEEKYWMNWLLNKPCQIAFVDGNHENFDVIDSFPIIERWNGLVQPVFTNIDGKQIYRLRRGEVYNICDLKIFTFGGAKSYDQNNRVEFVSWWRQELPSYSELDNAYSNLEKHQFCVDFVLTHTAPYQVFKKLQDDFTHLKNHDIDCPCSRYLQLIADRIKFRGWHFGHFHKDNFDVPLCYFDKFFLHFNNKPFLLY